MSGGEPSKQRSTDIAYMNKPSWAGCKSGTDFTIIHDNSITDYILVAIRLTSSLFSGTLLSTMYIVPPFTQALVFS